MSIAAWLSTSHVKRQQQQQRQKIASSWLFCSMLAVQSVARTVTSAATG
jgi:hypothetical protein